MLAESREVISLPNVLRYSNMVGVTNLDNAGMLR